MKYTIVSKTVREDTVVTVVDYDLDGVVVRESVAHFRPQSLDDVKLGIENRGMSEASKLAAATKCVEVSATVETGKLVTVGAK